MEPGDGPGRIDRDGQIGVGPGEVVLRFADGRAVDHVDHVGVAGEHALLRVGPADRGQFDGDPGLLLPELPEVDEIALGDAIGIEEEVGRIVVVTHDAQRLRLCRQRQQQHDQQSGEEADEPVQHRQPVRVGAAARTHRIAAACGQPCTTRAGARVPLAGGCTRVVVRVNITGGRCSTQEQRSDDRCHGTPGGMRSTYMQRPAHPVDRCEQACVESTKKNRAARDANPVYLRCIKSTSSRHHGSAACPRDGTGAGRPRSISRTCGTPRWPRRSHP